VSNGSLARASDRTCGIFESTLRTSILTDVVVCVGAAVKTVGLTGGIGSGKSTAAKILAEFGAYVIDADQVGHECYRPGSVGWQQIVDAFGDDVVAPDGQIDRKRLGTIVFADAVQLARLNQIVHPLISRAIRDRIASTRAAGVRSPIVVEAAVLIEANWRPLVDEVWVVRASRDAVFARVRAQRGLGPQAIQARIDKQISDDTRCRHADVVIDNSGTVEELRTELKRVCRERLGLDPDP